MAFFFYRQARQGRKDFDFPLAHFAGFAVHVLPLRIT